MRTRHAIALRLMLWGALAAAAAVGFATASPATPVDWARELADAAVYAAQAALPHDAGHEVALHLLVPPFARTLQAAGSMAAAGLRHVGVAGLLEVGSQDWPCLGFIGMVLTVLSIGVVCVLVLVRPESEQR